MRSESIGKCGVMCFKMHFCLPLSSEEVAGLFISINLKRLEPLQEG